MGYAQRKTKLSLGDYAQELHFTYEKYGSRMKTIKGCLDVLREIKNSGEDLLFSIPFDIVDTRLQDLLLHAEGAGIDVSLYRKEYQKIILQNQKKFRDGLARSRSEKLSQKVG